MQVVSFKSWSYVPLLLLLHTLQVQRWNAELISVEHFMFTAGVANLPHVWAAYRKTQVTKSRNIKI